MYKFFTFTHVTKGADGGETRVWRRLPVAVPVGVLGFVGVALLISRVFTVGSTAAIAFLAGALMLLPGVSFVVLWASQFDPPEQRH